MWEEILFLVRGRIRAARKRGYGGFLESEEQRKWEKSNCNQGYPGMLFVTLGIFTHVRFFSVFVFLNIYCIIDFVWTERATNCFVDIGCLFIFVPNLFVIFPISLSPLKNHEMWFYLILISHVRSPLLLFIL